MGKIDIAVAWAITIANDAAHGYDQTHRWGPDYDCSSFLISAWKQAGVPLVSTYTGNMYSDFTAHGFKDVTSSVNLSNSAGLERGDVLLNHKSHTVMYIGNGQIVQARINEKGTITGGMVGDQTGQEICISAYYNFPWDCVLRYMETVSTPESPKTESKQDTESADTYTVKAGDTLWGIADKLLGDGSRFWEIKTANGMFSDMIYPGQVLKIPDSEYTTVSVTLKKELWNTLQTAASIRGVTVGDVITELLSSS